MSSSLKTLLDMPVRSVFEVLEELCRLSARLAGNPVKATLYLRSGTQVVGCALKMAVVAPQGRVLLFLLGGEGFDRESGLLHIDIDSIAGVSVHDPLALMPEPPAPTRLELKRRFTAISTRLAQQGMTVSLDLDWAKLREDDDAHRALGSVADDLAAIFEGLAADPMAVAAIKEKLRAVSIDEGDHAQAHVRDGVFSVVVAPHGAPARETLHRTLELGL